MVTVSRRDLLPLVAPILVPTAASCLHRILFEPVGRYSFCRPPRLPKEVISKIAVNVRTSGGRI